MSLIVVGEILILSMLVLSVGFFFISSFLLFCAQFFFFSVFLSLVVGFYCRGWLGILCFLVFIGGILVILFYLGMYGTYYSLFKWGYVVYFILVLFFPLDFLFEKYLVGFGETSVSF
jgi:hypothetical protein